MKKSMLLTSENPIAENHTVYGHKLLPGLAYIDLLYQFFRGRGYDYRGLELRNLSIYQPLIVRQDHGVQLSIECSEIREGVWRIHAEGQETERESAPKRYAVAEMHCRQPCIFEENLDTSLLSSSPCFPLSDIYKRYQDQELVHTGVMKAEGTVCTSDTAGLIRISVPEEALAEAHNFMFHPTLIDGSGIGAGGLFSDTRGLFIPLFYESFLASELLQKGCITRIRKSSVKQKKELVSLDMEFFNESGQKVGELKNFVTKLVREAGLISPDRVRTNPALKSMSEPILPAFQTNDDSSCSEKIKGFLKSVIASKLQIPAEEISAEAGYYEMGLDSVMLLEIVAELEKKVSASLSPTLLFEHTTIKELSMNLSETYGDKFETVITEDPRMVSQQTKQIFRLWHRKLSARLLVR